MIDTPYPFVSDLLFRAKNHSISSLSATPITRLWNTEFLNPDIVMKQLESLLESATLSAPVKLRLGFLIGFSWPLHYHKNTENILLCAKKHIDENHPAESLLFWGNLASFYLRCHRIPLALEQLSQAFEWATGRATVSDLSPLIEWAILIFIRLNRPKDSFHFANVGRAINNQVQPYYHQNCEYARAASLMRMGNDKDSTLQLEYLRHRILQGNTHLATGNQVSVLHCLAQLSFGRADDNKTEHLLDLSDELNQLERIPLLEARLQLMRYKLARSRNDIKKVSTLFEKLAHYQDHERCDLDVLLSQQITLIRNNKAPVQSREIQVKVYEPSLEGSVLALHHQFNTCLDSLEIDHFRVNSDRARGS